MNIAPISKNTFLPIPKICLCSSVIHLVSNLVYVCLVLLIGIKREKLKFSPKDSNRALLDSKLYIIESLITSYNRNHKDKFLSHFFQCSFFFGYFCCSVVTLQRFDEVSTFQEGFKDYLCHKGERVSGATTGPWWPAPMDSVEAGRHRDNEMSAVEVRIHLPWFKASVDTSF